MNEKLKEIICKSVEANLVFQGSVGANYTIQELIHVVSLRSINTLWVNAKKQLTSLDSDSLFASSNVAKVTRQEFIVDALAVVFKYKQDIIEAGKKAEKIAEERRARLTILKSLKTEKELEKLGKMDLDKINEEIALASK